MKLNQTRVGLWFSLCAAPARYREALRAPTLQTRTGFR
jgi:hypothetical protein